MFGINVTFTRKADWRHPMNNVMDIEAAIEAQRSLSEVYPDSTNGAVPVPERYEMPMTDRGADYDALAEVPQAFEAYVTCQQSQWG